MMRSLTAFLLLLVSLQSCLFLYYEDKLTVSSDAYNIRRIDNFESNLIFIDPGQSIEDLSLLPFMEKLEITLKERGITVVKEKQQADLVLEFSAFLGDVRSRTELGTRSAPAGYKNQTVINEDGNEETVRVWQGNQDESFYYQSNTYEKVLSLKLRDKKEQQVIWQSTSIIDNHEKTYAPYSDVLVYSAMDHFMSESPEHPVKSEYGERQLEMIKMSLRKRD